jgi:hypothetical protein
VYFCEAVGHFASATVAERPDHPNGHGRADPVREAFSPHDLKGRKIKSSLKNSGAKLSSFSFP